MQGYIADSYAQLEQFRLFVLYAAWKIDKYNDYRKVRKDIAVAKIVMPTVLHDIAWRAMQVHGALGISNEMPFGGGLIGAAVMGMADGPTEVHKITIARQVLRDYKPADGLWPSSWIPGRIEAAKAKFGHPRSWRSATFEARHEPRLLGSMAEGLGLGPRRDEVHQRWFAERDLRDPS